MHHARAWDVGIEPGIFCRCEFARTSCLLGHPDRALEQVKEAERQARALGHPQTLAFTLLFRGLIHQLRREPRDVIAFHPELVELCERKGIGQELLWSAPVGAWALYESGDREDGLVAMRRGVDALASHQSMLLRPYFLLMFAEALWRSSRAGEAVALLDEAEAIADRMSQHMFDPEVHRLRGEVTLACDPSAREARAAIARSSPGGSPPRRGAVAGAACCAVTVRLPRLGRPARRGARPARTDRRVVRRGAAPRWTSSKPGDCSRRSPETRAARTTERLAGLY